MPGSPALYRFDRVTAPAAFEDCEALVPVVAGRLNGWRVAPWDTPNPPDPVLAVRRSGKGYDVCNRVSEETETYKNSTSAVIAFIADLIMAYGAEDQRNVFFHAAGVVVHDRLFVLPAKGHSGKSTLTAEMARRGARIFSDDVVPIDIGTGDASGLGIEPRMRLPLPPTSSPAFHAWHAAHNVLANRRYSYLGLPRSGPGALAPLGEKRPIAGFVQLDRREDAEPSLMPGSRPEIMSLLIRQHFGARAAMPEVIERFKALVEDVPCFVLSYARSADAAALLDELAMEAA